MRLLPASRPRLLALLLLLVAAVLAAPLLTIALRGPGFLDAAAPRASSTQGRARMAEASRPFAPTPDASITPLEAGELFHSLRSGTARREAAGFQFRPDIVPVLHINESAPYPGDSLFPGLGGSGWIGPNPLRVLEAVAGGVTPAQRAYLDAVAAAPAWQVWDRLARAPAADLIAGQFVLPFGDSATYHAMPIPRFAATKEFAYASVTRAAAHLSAGRPDSAEQALRSTIGVGFVLNDNASSLIDQLIGVVLVNIGRDALLDLWTRGSDPRAAELRARIEAATAATEAAAAADVPLRGLDIELAVVSRLRPCATVRGTLLGVDATDDTDFAQRRAALARFPGEQALFDLIARYPDMGTNDLWTGGETPPAAGLLTTLGDATAFLLRTPRIATCTRHAVAY